MTKWIFDQTFATKPNPFLLYHGSYAEILNKLPTVRTFRMVDDKYNSVAA